MRQNIKKYLITLFLLILILFLSALGRNKFVADSRIYYKNIRLISIISNSVNRNCYQTIGKIKKQLIKDEEITLLVSEKVVNLPNYYTRGDEFDLTLHNLFISEFNYTNISRNKHIDCYVCISKDKLLTIRIWKGRMPTNSEEIIIFKGFRE